MKISLLYLLTDVKSSIKLCVHAILNGKKENYSGKRIYIIKERYGYNISSRKGHAELFPFLLEIY